MRYHALAADYDGTLAHHGQLDEPTRAALRRLRESGRKAIMVTGRRLEELLPLIPEPEQFDRIVAENGALVYEPATKQVRPLAEPPPEAFVDELRRRGVGGIAVGHVIVASWEPHQDAIFHVIRDLGLELQVIFNKGAVMVLPTGINKATGLAAALAELGLSAHNVVGIGDAENDHALLALCECGAAVANALPALKAKADIVTRADHGAGVAELIDGLVQNDLTGVVLHRHRIELGHTDAGLLCLDPYSDNVMVCGTSGSGKSTLTTGLLERLATAAYQFAIIDPEGDYGEIETGVVLGGTQREPLIEEIVDVLRDPARNCAINMLGVALDHRPEFFARTMAALGELRARTGRPHWLVVDEAHHMLPQSWEPADPPRTHGMLYITVHPDLVAPAVVNTIGTLVALGERPAETVAQLCDRAGLAHPRCPEPDKLPPGQALYWKVGSPEAIVISFDAPKHERTRHVRKYIEGNLGKNRSFYFRGPDAKLNLKAQNLLSFVELAEGIDDATWEFHRTRGDYSRWFRDEVKDAQLADEAAAIEADATLSAIASRTAIKGAVDKRYTLPADKPSGVVDEADA